MTPFRSLFIVEFQVRLICFILKVIPSVYLLNRLRGEIGGAPLKMSPQYIYIMSLIENHSCAPAGKH